ncbi:uncharacterized protein K460DRAFT_331941 [Cucurbitaria berberidis CBS 394.84]|uniref:Uncharacterized protein n=1 Tax=Cucurbitaria berberidis CBS 394.84 TaxID=1168544 RepID=A0A9P4LA87_9PLEO|nr:uncharacterized protein K460DRAFT_331941 [Cucurbitaria berberidis CBS 394.84]KAF1847193.1 hypothetical protein K460DRAFT_331941 [Cucurbitaria berberidis CBS 394.84]
MPHKHKRVEDNASEFNLPPSVHAAALPVGKARTFSTAPKGKKRKINHIEGYGVDDTPKAFQRLMAFSKGGAKKRSGLDDGLVKTKKQKKAEQKTLGDAEAGVPNKSEEQAPPKAALKIQPGESMVEFRQRVDMALPLSGLSKTGKKVEGVSDHRVTKHERRLKRLQKGWREEEARIRDKEMEEKELAEEDEDELAAMWEDKTSDLPPTHTNGKKMKKKKNKRKLVVGEIDNNSEDEWEALKRTREERKGLHDIVSAPPTFTKAPREIFKVKNGAGAKVGNVPNAVGSLRKREEIGEERNNIIESYRALMASKKKT